MVLTTKHTDHTEMPCGQLMVDGYWLKVARWDCWSAHSRVATFEKIDKRAIDNKLAHVNVPWSLPSLCPLTHGFALAVHEKRQRDRRD